MSRLPARTDRRASPSGATPKRSPLPFPILRRLPARDRAALAALQEIPNVGPAIARDLLRLGIRKVEDLKKQDPRRMYARLGRMDGVRHDPCLLDVFTAVVSFARGGPARPWWEFTPERKRSDLRRSR
jgi:hypothetical protein